MVQKLRVLKKVLPLVQSYIGQPVAIKNVILLVRLGTQNASLNFRTASLIVVSLVVKVNDQHSLILTCILLTLLLPIPYQQCENFTDA